MSRQIISVYRLDQFPASWWKALCLRFVPLQEAESDGVKLAYKMMFGDMYITKLERPAPKLCARCGGPLN